MGFYLVGKCARDSWLFNPYVMHLFVRVFGEKTLNIDFISEWIMARETWTVLKAHFISFKLSFLAHGLTTTKRPILDGEHRTKTALGRNFRLFLWSYFNSIFEITFTDSITSWLPLRKLYQPLRSILLSILEESFHHKTGILCNHRTLPL